ncbi:MAG: hypothetical protein PHY42_05800 [Bacilli bacterium]|nr:hypothetical protein [Bacilli bacterium]
MSRRTAEANKAINDAWLREQQLVSEGKGTRDWTHKQQKDILERGKAYDDDGKVLEGHHMKNVATNPEYQGNPDNIQFLTRSEHYDAHGGNYQTSTNGYYNPNTGETIEFDIEGIEPCPIIDLSNPVIKLTNSTIKDCTKNDGKTTQNNSNSDDTYIPKMQNTKQIPATTKISSNSVTVKKIKIIPNKRDENFFKSRFNKIKKTFVNFETLHPIASLVLNKVAVIAVEVSLNYVVSKAIGSSKSNKISSGVEIDNDTYTQIPSINNNSIVEKTFNVDGFDKTERASPIMHPVREYDRKLNGKNIHVSSYSRGGNGKKTD